MQDNNIQYITKTFTFDAGHRLSDYEGKCKRLHGHTYLLEVTVSGYLSKLGFVMDFGDLKDLFKNTVDEKFDHRFLLKKGDPINERLAQSLPTDDTSICWVDYNPTAENISKDIYRLLEGGLPEGIAISKIRLYETPTSFAEYTKS